MSGNVFDLDNMIRKRYYVDNKSDLSEIEFESNDQVYVINDNQLYQVQVTSSGLVLYKINTRSPAAIEYKGSVATTGDLPLTGNTLGDMYIVQQNGHMYVWKSNNSSGTIDDWVDNGPGVDMSGYQEKITAIGILKGDGNGGVTPAEAGTDYGTYSKPANGIPSSDFDSSTQAQLLPAVTSVDDGKFARVVNGAWAAVTIPEAAGGDF